MDCMRIVERTEQCMVRAERAAMIRVQEEREVAVKRAAALLKLAVSARLTWLLTFDADLWGDCSDMT